MKLTSRSHSAFRIEAGAAKILIDPFPVLGQRVDRLSPRYGGWRSAKASWDKLKERTGEGD